MNRPMPEDGDPLIPEDEADAGYIEEEVGELAHVIRMRKDMADRTDRGMHSGIVGIRVDEMDAICDILFATLSYAMRRYTPEQLGRSYAAVCAANGRKAGGPVRADGKQLKPPGWVGPEAEIAEVVG